MSPEDLQKIRDGIRDVHDFPKPGIVFKDITPVLAQAELLRLALDGLTEVARDQRVDKVVGIDARGFIFGAAVADRLGAGFIPVRKKGKLPWRSHAVSYALEYGFAEIELHEDAIAPGEKVLLVDDLLATGGTAAAASELITRLEGELIACAFLIELGFLHGRAKLPDGMRVESLLTY